MLDKLINLIKEKWLKENGYNIPMEGILTVRAIFQENISLVDRYSKIKKQLYL
jgi:hypothetical protein